MKQLLDDGSVTDNSLADNVTVDPVVRGFIRDWDAIEDLLHHVLYTGLGWEIGNEGQILFTDPLCTPKVSQTRLLSLPVHIYSWIPFPVYAYVLFFARLLFPFYLLELIRQPFVKWNCH